MPPWHWHSWLVQVISSVHEIENQEKKPHTVTDKNIYGQQVSSLYIRVIHIELLGIHYGV